MYCFQYICVKALHMQLLTLSVSGKEANYLGIKYRKNMKGITGSPNCQFSWVFQISYYRPEFISETVAGKVSTVQRQAF